MKKLLGICCLLLGQGLSAAALTREETKARLEAIERAPESLDLHTLENLINTCTPANAWKVLQIGAHKRTLAQVLYRAGKLELVRSLVQRGVKDPQLDNHLNEPHYMNGRNDEERNKALAEREFHDLIVDCVQDKSLGALKKYYEEGGTGNLFQVHYEGNQSLYDWLHEKRTFRAYEILMIAAPYQRRNNLFLTWMITFNVENLFPEGMYYLRTFLDKIGRPDSIDELRHDNKILGEWLFEKALQVPQQPAPGGNPNAPLLRQRTISDSSYRARLILRMMDPYRNQNTDLSVFQEEHKNIRLEEGWLVPGADQDTDEAFCELVLRCLAFSEPHDLINFSWYMFVYPRSWDATTYKGRPFTEFFDRLSSTLFKMKNEVDRLFGSGRDKQQELYPHKEDEEPGYVTAQLAQFSWLSIDDPFFVPLVEKFIVEHPFNVDAQNSPDGVCLGKELNNHKAHPHILELLKSVNPYRTNKLSADQLVLGAEPAPNAHPPDLKKAPLASQLVPVLVIALVCYLIYQYLKDHEDDESDEKSSKTLVDQERR